MNRPTLEVADIISSTGNRFIQRHRDHLSWPQLKVLQAIRNCRTAALGGHVDRCSRCGRQAISYNSCRNRHCPKCQTNQRDQWLAKRMQDLLPVPYFHLVFTLPHDLSGLVLQNKKLLYDLLFRATAETLLDVACTAHSVREVPPAVVPAELGRLRQASVWRTRTRAALPCTLHAPRCYLESSAACLRR